MNGMRAALVTFIALLEIAAFATTLATFNDTVAEFGYNIGSDGVTIASVEPGLPAAKAGLAAGDRLVYSSMSRVARMNAVFNEPVEPADTLHLQVVRDGRERSVTLTPVPFPSLYGVSDVFYGIAGLALGAVSLALVLLRPSRLTWGFALIAPAMLLPEALLRWSHHAPAGPALTYEIAASMLFGVQAAGTMTFAARFPDDQPRGFSNAIDRLAIPTGIVIATIYAYVSFNLWFSPTAPHPALLFAQDYLTTSVPAVAALLALIVTYATTSGSLRSRLTPTLVAFFLLVLTGAAQQVSESVTSNPSELLFAYFAFAIAAVLVAISVAYAVVRHRVIDVSFIVGRTLVYTTLTLFAVGVFSTIEYLVGKLLERGGLALVLEILAAAAIGLSMNALHGRLDRTIDVVLFRRRHLAEARLKRAAAMLPQATTREFVDEALVREPLEALDLASAATFLLDEERGSYDRTAAAGWNEGDASRLGADDELVVRLRTEREPQNLSLDGWRRTDLPRGVRQPLYAIPVTLGGRVQAIAVYGGHSEGEDLDPDERRWLRRLTAGAALAYDHLSSLELRRRLEAVQAENVSLHRVERTLRQLLETRLKSGDSAETAG